jgi:hypothetical protein
VYKIPFTTPKPETDLLLEAISVKTPVFKSTVPKAPLSVSAYARASDLLAARAGGAAPAFGAAGAATFAPAANA